jgi:hypothetical protein
MLSLAGFIAGIAYAQYSRRRFDQSFLPRIEKPVSQEKTPAVPMQTLDDAMKTARHQRKKPEYTTH